VGETALREPMYKLVISDAEGHTTVVPLLRKEVTIGRTEGNTIRLTERNVSRRHARLLKRNGSYVIEDLGSYNGVVLNGDRIDAKIKLSAGDQLGIGDYDLAFHSDAADLVPPSTSMRPKSAPPPRLVVLGEPAAGAEFSLSKPVLRIGRDEDIDIWINHKSISHEHAEVQVDDDKVTVFDLDSANGTFVNGIRASRAILEAGDIVELGQVRFRFLPPQTAHSLAPPVEEPASATSASPESRPAIALIIIALLLGAVAGALFITLRGESFDEGGATSSTETLEQPVPASPKRSRVSSEQAAVASEPEVASAEDALAASAEPEEPQEWERQLTRAQRALARGRISRAYAIADELPADSVLRQTSEFAEIRYRYAQSHIFEGQQAPRSGDASQALAEAKLVLGLDGITAKQRRDARRLKGRADAALR
jgi:pSer/pThr/pTyr-binding forkhead associated (FHA) protein